MVPDITIALPFYNAASTLRTAIGSILSQTIQNFELLLCDDGSSDKSLEIAHSFKDPRIKIFSDGQRKRLPVRLNQCIDHARAPYFARMDADDVSFPERLEKQLAFLSSNTQIDMCGCAAIVISNNNQPIWRFTPPTDHTTIIKAPSKGFPLWHPTWMGRTDWFRRWHYNEKAHLSQDQELLFRSYQNSIFANLNDALLAYRVEEVKLKRMFYQKMFWTRYVCKAPNGPKSLTAKAGFIGIQILRLGMNCASKVTGGLNWSRQFATPLTNDEVTSWIALQKNYFCNNSKY